MSNRNVGSYVMLSASRAAFPLVLPEHFHPITGEEVPSATLYGGLPLEQGAPLMRSTDGQRILFGGEWTGDEMFGLAMLSHADGTGAAVLSYGQVLALMQTPEWKNKEQES